MLKKMCKKCGVEKDLNEFYKVIKEKSNGDIWEYYFPECKNCTIEKSTNWGNNNKERRREIQSKYDSTPVRNGKRLEVSKRRRLNGQYREWQRNNKELVSALSQNWRAMMINLPYSLTKDSINSLLNKFESKCSLTNGSVIEMDHFIPLSWGHGGSYIGNVIPLEKSLNHSKKDLNPFEWIKKTSVLNRIDIKKWKKLIEYLAKENGLTPRQFEEYVYWCENNKRTLKEVKKQGKISSLDLWKNSLKDE